MTLYCEHVTSYQVRGRAGHIYHVSHDRALVFLPREPSPALRSMILDSMIMGELCPRTRFSLADILVLDGTHQLICTRICARMEYAQGHVSPVNEVWGCLIHAWLG